MSLASNVGNSEGQQQRIGYTVNAATFQTDMEEPISNNVFVTFKVPLYVVQHIEYTNKISTSRPA